MGESVGLAEVVEGLLATMAIAPSVIGPGEDRQHLGLFGELIEHLPGQRNGLVERTRFGPPLEEGLHVIQSQR